jgi:hypothetical protein
LEDGPHGPFFKVFLMATHGIPLENVDSLILIFSLLPLALSIWADNAPGEWRYLYKFALTTMGIVVNLFLGWMYMGTENVINMTNGAYIEFWELASVFFIITALYVLLGAYNAYEFYKYQLEPEMNQ